MLKIDLQGEEMTLLTDRAMWWAAQKTIIVADIHWGKSAHFRKHGIAMPTNIQPQDEIRLAALVKDYDAERMIVAGDMFHSKANEETDGFTHWREAHQSLHIDLVAGNHDILPKEHLAAWDITVHKKGLYVGPYYIAHDVPKECDTFCIHGHVHPAIRISRRGHIGIKLNCFCEDENRFILPAYGKFTGNYLLKPDEHRHIYVIAENEVIKWS